MLTLQGKCSSLRAKTAHLSGHLLPGVLAFCSLEESQQLAGLLLAALPFGGQENEALWQTRDLQAARSLIETVTPAYRIERHGDQILLIQQDATRHALNAWVLPEGDRERAVKAVLAAEGDYSPRNEGERFALHILFNSLETPDEN